MVAEVAMAVRALAEVHFLFNLPSYIIHSAGRGGFRGGRGGFGDRGGRGGFGDRGGGGGYGGFDRGGRGG